MIVPSWRVSATIKEKPEGHAVLARPEHVLLSVADDDLDVIVATLKRNGYDKIEAERESFPQVGAFVHEQEAS